MNTLFAGLGRSVWGKTVPLVFHGHSFSQYRPPGWQIMAGRYGEVYLYYINLVLLNLVLGNLWS